jgi:hypothetical protein
MFDRDQLSKNIWHFEGRHRMKDIEPFLGIRY